MSYRQHHPEPGDGWILAVIAIVTVAWTCFVGWQAWTWIGKPLLTYIAKI